MAGILPIRHKTQNNQYTRHPSDLTGRNPNKTIYTTRAVKKKYEYMDKYTSHSFLNLAILISTKDIKDIY